MRRGEIVGIAGVDGNGQRELALAIAGLIKPISGSIELAGVDITGTRDEIVQAGLRHIPEDRHSMGLILEFSVAENMILKRFQRLPFTRNGVLQPRAILAHAASLVKKFDVRTRSVNFDHRRPVRRQPARWCRAAKLDQDPVLLIAAQPTRGLDVGATEYIHHVLVEQRGRGVAILLISTELEEILALSDRVAVLYEGHIVGEVPGDRANTQKIGLMMAGVYSIPETLVGGRMTGVDLLLIHGMVVTQDDGRRVIPDGAVAIRGDRIGPSGQPPT